MSCLPIEAVGVEMIVQPYPTSCLALPCGSPLAESRTTESTGDDEESRLFGAINDRSAGHQFQSTQDIEYHLPESRRDITEIAGPVVLGSVPSHGDNNALLLGWKPLCYHHILRANGGTPSTSSNLT